MEESLIYSNVASELLEIFKYLDKEIKGKIPEKIEDNLEKIKNKEYKFAIDKTKELNEQKILPETRQILSIIYLKYCCSKEESDEILQENYEIKRLKEIEKREKYNPDNIFKNKKQEETEHVQLIDINNIPWHRKILNNITRFLRNIFKR